MSESIIARFDVTGWDESGITGLTDADWLGAIVMRKTFTEGMTGSSVLHFVSSGTEETGQSYLAVERITGALPDGRSGELTVHHGGLQTPSGIQAVGWIVPGTGTGDFAGWQGSALIHHDDRGPYFVFALD